MAVCNLPVEIIANIFLYLDRKSKGRAAQVCSLWREASFYRPAWWDVRAAIKIDDSAEFVCSALGRRDIRNVCVTCVQRSLLHHLQLIPYLEELDLSRCTNLSDANLLRTFNRTFSYLEELNLSRCTNVTTEGVRAAVYAGENLQVLNLSGCIKIVDDILFDIALMLPRLIALNIAGTSVTDRGFEYFFTYLIQDRNLEGLVIQNCQRITDDGLETISKRMLRLRGLDLSRCNNITDSGMRHVANINSLVELNLEYCSWLTDSGLTFLCMNLRLISLKIGPSKVTNEGMLTIATLMRTLQQLALNSCCVGDAGIQYLCQSLDLKKLIIFQCDITDNSLFKIHDYCVHLGLLPSLCYIDVYGCSKVTSAGVWELLKVPGMVLDKPGLIVKLNK